MTGDSKRNRRAESRDTKTAVFISEGITALNDGTILLSTAKLHGNTRESVGSVAADRWLPKGKRLG